MIIVNTKQISGMEIVQALGVVSDNTVQAKQIGKDIVGGFRGLVDGKMKEYEVSLTKREKLQRLK